MVEQFIHLLSLVLLLLLIPIHYGLLITFASVVALEVVMLILPVVVAVVLDF